MKIKNKLKLLSLSIESINEYAILSKKEISNKYTCIEDVIGSKDILMELGFNYAIIYNYDSVHFGKLEDLVIDLDNIIEAKYFNMDGELSFYRSENDFVGNIAFDAGEDELVQVEKLYIYRNKRYNNLKVNNYEKLLVKKYIELDDDFQGYFNYVKPCSFIKGR